MGKLQTRLSVAICMMACTLAGVQAAARIKTGHLRLPDWSLLPYQLGEWQGRDTHFDPLFGTDPADSSLLRIYTSASATVVIVYAGFHKDLPSSLDYHSPQLCYPAQGWKIERESTCLVGEFRRTWIKANEIQVTKDGGKRLVTWWYHAGPTPFQKRLSQMYRMVLMSMITGRTDGTIVRLETPIVDNDEAGAQARILNFSHLLLPNLEGALPR